MVRRRRAREIRARLHPGQDDDLIQWLDQFDDQPYGAMSQAIKDTLRRGIGATPDQPTPSAPAPDLTELRQVVEAAVTQALARFEVQVSGAAIASTPDEDDEIEGLLDDLGAGLVVADEE